MGRLHVVYDVETMAVSPRAAVASLGAVAFDPWGDEPLRAAGRVFHESVSMREQNGRRDFDGETIAWWLRQSEPAQGSLLVNPRPPGDVLWKFSDFLRANDVEYGWSYGANFDHPIVATLWAEFSGNPRYPLPFNRQFCARTLCKASGAPRPEASGIEHVALDDAVHTAEWIRRAMARLKVERF